MGKTPKLKQRPSSVRSRAARREASPSINLDKSLKTLKAAPEPTNPYSVLGAQNAGVQKKRNKKQLSRQQKARQMKAMEKADANSSKLEQKVDRSTGRGKKVRARNADWENVNLSGLKQVDSQNRSVLDNDKMANLGPTSTITFREDDGTDIQPIDIPLLDEAPQGVTLAQTEKDEIT